MTASTTARSIRLDRTPRRIRAMIGGATIADSTRARLAYADGKHPEYMVPTADIDRDRLTLAELGGSDHFGDFRNVTSRGTPVGKRYVIGLAAELVRFEFEAVDAWFEEDEQIWVHPRDPYRRVDVLESSRVVEVSVDGVPVASSRRPRLVTETSLPERWYIPRADVDWSRLVPSSTTSACQYKGIASWWHMTGDDTHHADLVWGYERPISEAPKLAGLVAFYGEHAAVETFVNGVAQPKPEFDPSWLNPSLHV